ncbi:hypothetical protein ACWDUN_25800 [Mycobacterium sp. NPDC003323]
MTVWVIAGLLGLATGLRIGWALVNKQSLVSTAMILALGSLGIVAALNWQPLTLLIDTALRWPNISVALSQVALIACAAGSCVMITTVASDRKPTAIRRIAIAQYVFAAGIAVATLVDFFRRPQETEMAPEEYLRRHLAPGGSSAWLLPMLYVLLALTLVAWAGVRHSNRTRRGRALFVFSIGMVLMVLASAFFLLRAVGNTDVLGVGAAATLLGCAMAVVAGGSLLPSVEDWFGARREMRVIAPLLAELNERHPDVGIGVRPRGPLLFRVAEQMSLISDSLYLEAIAAEGLRRRAVDAGAGTREPDQSLNISDIADLDSPPVPADEQARGIATWIYDGRDEPTSDAHESFPGLNWLRQPTTFSDREWILAIAEQYRGLVHNT